jgi:hypothetical protein
MFQGIISLIYSKKYYLLLAYNRLKLEEQPNFEFHTWGHFMPMAVTLLLHTSTCIKLTIAKQCVCFGDHSKSNIKVSEVKEKGKSDIQIPFVLVK